MQTQQEPKLAPPGAGLPFPQYLFVRYVLGPMKSRKKSWEENRDHFNVELGRILELIKDMSEEELTKRVLVPSQPGLEDSSRYWSVAMTLDHLMIVSANIAAIIEKLGRGESFPTRADTALVKPAIQENGTQTRLRFESFHKGFAQRVLDSALDRDSPIRHEHPWFGPFTAAQWYWLLGTHNGIHRRQIQAIRRGLAQQ